MGLGATPLLLELIDGALSAAELTHGEFHVIVPRWVANRDGRQVAKQIAELVGVKIGFIWAI